MRFGPRPGMPSRAEAKLFLARRPRWKAMAKRCASSRTCSTSFRAGEVRSRRMPVRCAGVKMISSRLAREMRGISRDAGIAEPRDRGRELRLAAVDQDEAGHAGSLLLETRITPADDLPETPDVVRPFDRPDLELPVFRLVGNAAVEHHERTDRFCPLPCWRCRSPRSAKGPPRARGPGPGPEGEASIFSHRPRREPRSVRPSRSASRIYPPWGR